MMLKSTLRDLPLTGRHPRRADLILMRPRLRPVPVMTRSLLSRGFLIDSTCDALLVWHSPLALLPELLEGASVFVLGRSLP